MLLTWLACIFAAYVIGSIPFGVMIARSQGVNIREHGSKNIGATNVWRVLGKRLGMLCFALDCLKGAAPVLAAGLLTGVIGEGPSALTAAEMTLWLTVAAAAVLGHMYSIFLRFAGGKGVATGCGAMLAMYPLLTWPALAAIAIWYGALRLFHYVSLASVLAALSLPLSCLIGASLTGGLPESWAEASARLVRIAPLLLGTAAIAALVVYRHRANIGRIRRGAEPKAKFDR